MAVLATSSLNPRPNLHLLLRPVQLGAYFLLLAAQVAHLHLRTPEPLVRAGRRGLHRLALTLQKFQCALLLAAQHLGTGAALQLHLRRVCACPTGHRRRECPVLAPAHMVIEQKARRL